MLYTNIGSACTSVIQRLAKYFWKFKILSVLYDRGLITKFLTVELFLNWMLVVPNVSCSYTHNSKSWGGARRGESHSRGLCMLAD